MSTPKQKHLEVLTKLGAELASNIYRPHVFVAFCDALISAHGLPDDGPAPAYASVAASVGWPAADPVMSAGAKQIVMRAIYEYATEIYPEWRYRVLAQAALSSKPLDADARLQAVLNSIPEPLPAPAAVDQGIAAAPATAEKVEAASQATTVRELQTKLHEVFVGYLQSLVGAQEAVIAHKDRQIASLTARLSATPAAPDAQAPLASKLDKLITLAEVLAKQGEQTAKRRDQVGKWPLFLTAAEVATGRWADCRCVPATGAAASGLPG